jgi:tetratricopeptide (TPR) repeat protein
MLGMKQWAFSKRLFSTSVMSFLLLAGSLSLSACTEEDLLFGQAVGKLNSQAQLAMQQGDAEQAVHYLEGAVLLKPREVNSLFNLAVAYQSNTQYEQAVATYAELLKLQPEKAASLHRAIGMSYEALADAANVKLEETLETLETSVPACTSRAERKANEAEVSRLLATTSNSFKLAVAEYEKALSYNPEQPEALQAQIEELNKALTRLEETAA